MTTIKLAVLKHTKSKDGTYKIRISIGHKSETHYIITKYRVNNLSNFVNGVVVGQPDAKSINIKLRQLLNEYDEKLERIPNTGDLSCEELRNLLRKMPSSNHSHTLSEMCYIYCTKLINEGRKNTADIIQYHIKRFMKYTNGDMFLSSITPRTIDDYIHHLKAAGTSNGYINMSIAPVRLLCNYAQKMSYVHYEQSPFAYFKKIETQPREIDLPVEDMRKIFNYTPPMRKTQRTLDLFKLSYALGGMNMADILEYDFRSGDTLSYIRKKTSYHNSRPTRFTIQPEAKAIIDKYMNPKTGRLDVMGKGDYHSFLVCINRSLKTIAKNLNLSRHRISIYSARKSFVQHGFDLGIPLEVLEYCIGQSMKKNRPIFSYAKVMITHADAAIRKILDNIKNPPPSQAEDK